MTAWMVRGSVLVAVALAAASARAQAGTQPPAPQPAPAAPAPAPPPQATPGSQSTAGSQGQSSTAQPSSPGASSQQVVVNPPQPVPPAGPPSSTTVVNPPPAGTVLAQPYGEVAVVERRERPNPLAIVAMDAAYGGVAGLLVGGGVALVQEGDDWGRDLMVGAGIGLIVGAVAGVVHAVYEQQQHDRAARRAAAPPPPGRLVARDGLNRTDRDPVISARAVGLALEF